MESHRTVPMRLYASWETDRIATNCVPRTCTVQFSHLTLLKPDPDISCVVLAVKLQGFKRTLRSNDVPVVARNGTVDVELDISFTLQYPHVVKRRGNNLQVLLQRRKKYKNRPIPGGFKTLAVGVINLTDVVQGNVDRELCVYHPDEQNDGEVVVSGPPAGKLFMVSCSSQAIDHDDSRHKDRDIAAELYSDDDANEDEDSTNEEGGSDSDPNNHAHDSSKQGWYGTSTPGRRTKTSKITAHSRFIGSVHNRNRNLKQKFVALLKKFKISEEALSVAESTTGVPPTEQELQALFEELENMSDSGGEGQADDISVRSTPKPCLRPYFASSKEQLAYMANVSPINRNVQRGMIPSEESIESEMSQADGDSDPPKVHHVPTIPILKQGSAVGTDHRKRVITPQTRTVSDLTSERPVVRVKVNDLVSRKQIAIQAVADQINTVIPCEDKLPDSMCLVSAIEISCQKLFTSLSERQWRLIYVNSFNDVKSVISALVTRIQKFCNSNAVSPHPLTVSLLGGDRLLGHALKSFAECFAQRPSEWQHYIRFSVIAPVTSCASRCLAVCDPYYSGAFCDALWKETWDKAEVNEFEVMEMSSRICKYILQARVLAPLPIAEAMLQLWDKSSPEGSMQVFVPFLMEVRLGTDSAVDFDASADATACHTGQGSPPAAKTLIEQPAMHTSPPASPHLMHGTPSQSISMGNIPDATGLQIEFWPMFKTQGGMEGKRMTSVSDPPTPSLTQSSSPSVNQASKSSSKTGCKSLVVGRQPAIGSEGTPCFSVQFVKDRKKESVLQKLGMKNKERPETAAVHNVEGVSRLICSCKHSTFKVYIDGVEWSNVKYFQISSAWQTQVKHFPLHLYTGHTQ